MSSSGRHSDRRRVEGQLSGACQSLRYALAKERSGLRSGVLKSYSRYYNKVRTHRSLDKDAPISRPVQRAGSITSHALLGGLHHHYVRYTQRLELFDERSEMWRDRRRKRVVLVP